MDEEQISSCPDFGPSYEFCPDGEWWKSGISYEAAVEKSITASNSPSLEREFNERAERWTKETGIHSSPVIRFMHKDYQSIMARGKSVIPFILKRLKTHPDDWFWALKHITDFDAAESVGAKSFPEAIEAWLNWGVSNGYLAK